MNFQDMSVAVSQAKTALEHADELAGRIARLLEGRLRKVDSYTLKRLKRELRQFNMHTGRWQP